MADEPTTSPRGSQGETGDAELAPGRVFAGHEIRFEAGRGGMGIVYAALHLRLQVRRALKVLTAKAAADSLFRTRFEHESQQAAALEHPNIVPVYEAGESDGILYLSMRYVDGPDLRQVLASHRRLPPDRVVDVVGQLAAALDAAHGQGLVHRDVKPANVLMEAAGAGERVFLADFGISRLLTRATDLTETGEMLGTVNYVAPEQIAGELVDARADVYSLACVAYEALTGAAPFERETQLATMFAHANDPRPHPSAARHELPPGLDQVFEQGLAIEPDDRYGSASEFADQLSRGVAGERTGDPSSRRLELFPRRAMIAAVALVAIAATVAGLGLGGVFDGDQDGSGAREPGTISAPPARAVATVEVASEPIAIAVGELNVWTASTSGRAISAIVPASNDLARPPTPVDGMPVSIAVAFGSVWAVDQRGDALLRLDPGEGGVPVRIPVGGRPTDVAVSEANLWVTNQADDTVSRIDPVNNQVDATAAVGDAPSSVAVGEGGVWVAGSGDGTVTEIDPASTTPRGAPIQVGRRPTSVVAGSGGVWVADPEEETVLRVSAGSRAVSSAIDVGAAPTSITTGYGYVWVTRADSSVQRIDPTQLLPAGEPIPVGSAPTGIAAGKGFLWTADSGDSTVTRIDPRSDEAGKSSQ